MPEEIFDVVNERDEIIGKLSRAEVHRLGLRHRAIHILIFKSRGEVFLQKRSMKKDNFPGTWDSSAAGHLDCGEDYDACALRELREEIGLELSAAPQRLFKIGACAQTDQEHLWVYRCQAQGPFIVNPDEIERGDWVSLEHLRRWMEERPQDFTGALLLIWKKTLWVIWKKIVRALREAER